MKKICFGCNTEKELSEFHRHRGHKDGKSSTCKLCASKKMTLYARTEGAKAVRAKYFAEYKDREESRQKLQDYHREYQRNMPEEQRRQRTLTNKRSLRANPRSRLYVMLYAAAKRRPTENIATIDDLMEMFEAQKGLCAVSDVQMTWSVGSVGKKVPTSISLDRINNDKGYEIENLRLVCWQVNVFKNCWSDTEMFTMAKAIVANMERNSPEPSWNSFSRSTYDEDRSWVQ